MISEPLGLDPVAYLVHCAAACPYFAEVPAFCWGNVDYGFETDARTPTDREWRLGRVCKRRHDLGIISV